MTSSPLQVFRARQEGLGFGDTVDTAPDSKASLPGSPRRRAHRHGPSLAICSPPPVPTLAAHRKFSLPTESMAYPMLASRMDAVPPVPALPLAGSNSKIAAPVPFTGKFVHRPPPIKIPEPAPSFGFKSRFGKVPETKATDDAAKLKARERKKTKGEAEAEEAQSRLAQNQAAFFAQFPEEEATLCITTAKANEMARARATASVSPTTRNGRIPVPSIDDLRFDALFPDAPISPIVHARNPYPRSSHRRAASVESPKTNSPSTFESPPNGARRATTYEGSSMSARPISTATVRRSRVPLKHPLPLDSPPATPTGPTRPSIVTALSSTPIADAFYSPTNATSSRHRLQARPSTLLDRGSIGVSVRDSAGEHDVARAPFGPHGVTVFMRSAHRPEDVEVSLSSSPSYDEDGRIITTWEIKILPRSSPPQTYPSLRPRFSTYRLGTVPVVKMENPAPASPRSSLPDVDAPSIPPPVPDIDFLDEPYTRQRKASDMTTSSISSESSGPQTPRRGSRFDSEDGSSRKSSASSPAKPRFGYYQPTIDGTDDAAHTIVISGRRKSASRVPRVGPDVLLSEEDLSSTSELPALSSFRRSRVLRTSKSEGALAALSPEADLADASAEDGSDDDASEYGGEGSDGDRRTLRDIELALARQKTRAVSKWSDTDGGDSDDDGAPIDPNITSWSNVPDASDESM